MVTKLIQGGLDLISGSVLAKILMVTKHARLSSQNRHSSVLAKILMVTKLT